MLLKTLQQGFAALTGCKGRLPRDSHVAFSFPAHKAPYSANLHLAKLDFAPSGRGSPQGFFSRVDKNCGDVPYHNALHAADVLNSSGAQQA